jgi:hypothetical protein
MVTKAELQEHFEECNSKLPKPLAALASFDSKLKGECCSGYFELEPADATDWFSDGSELAEQFIAFGQNADGGLYAYWLHDELSAAKAPIVYLGSEGGGQVIANSTEEFLQLLAVGADELGVAATGGSIEPPAEPTAALKSFRKWLKEKFDLTMPKDPMKLVEKAQASHPDLNELIGGGGKAESASAAEPQKPTGPLADWSDVDTLHRLFGVKEKSPEFKTFLKAVGTARRVYKDGALSYDARDKGLLVLFDYSLDTQDWSVHACVVCAPKCEGYPKTQPYPGKLPKGVTFSDRREGLPAKLGKPEFIPPRTIAGGAIKIGSKDAFDFEAYRLIFAYSEKDEQNIDHGYVRTLPAKKD